MNPNIFTSLITWLRIGHQRCACVSIEHYFLGFCASLDFCIYQEAQRTFAQNVRSEIWPILFREMREDLAGTSSGDSTTDISHLSQVAGSFTNQHDEEGEAPLDSRSTS